MGLVMPLVSCVMTDELSDCPVVAAVRDKNYDNAVEAGTPLLDENLPMLSYISINSMVLRNQAGSSGNYTVYEEIVSPGELVHPVARERFSQGINSVTLTGGHSAGARQYAAGQTAVTLHPDGVEGEDIYIGHDEITYPPAAEHTIWLYRTKGMLIINPANMPSDTRSLGISISGLYAAADSGTGNLPIYSGTVSVSKSFDVTVAGSSGRFPIILAPSAEGSLSPLTITFALADGTTETVTTGVTIIRNHITLIRPEYNVITKTWTIEVMINGNWVRIENLNITD